MKDTVFSPSFGNRPTQFVGRNDTVRTLVSGLDTAPGSRERAVVLLGQRGSGKTVLLWELADRAKEAGFVVATPTVASEGMLERIVEKIQDAGEEALGQRKQHLTGGSIGALGFSAGLQFAPNVQETKSFQYKLTSLARRLSEQGKGLLILVDELQANSPEVRQLVIAYQELVGEGLNVAMVMAGLPGAVSATLNDKVLTFLNRATKMELGPLSFAEVDSFFKRSFDKLGLHVKEAERIRMTEAVEGSPYMLQLVGHNLVLYAPEDGKIGNADVESALSASRREFENDICGTTLAALSDKDIDFLRAMVKMGLPARMVDIASTMGETQDYAQKYRRRLMDAGVILAPERGKVDFAVPHLEGFLKSSGTGC